MRGLLPLWYVTLCKESLGGCLVVGGVWLVGMGRRSVSTCKFVRVMPVNDVVGVWKSPAA